MLIDFDMELKNQSISELLKNHVTLLDELSNRGVLRTANNPTGDYAEWLFCHAFDWDQAENSVKGFDATDKNNLRYQIKGRRLHQVKTSRRLSAIRDLDGFDILAGVLFERDFSVKRAAFISSKLVRECSSFDKHTNSYIFNLRDDIWNFDGVRDVTNDLRNVLQNEVGCIGS